MRSFFSHQFAILATIATIALVNLHNHPLLNTVMIIITIAAWYYELHNVKQNSNDVINIVKRVHQLKQFSTDLQQMVHTELGLVQEDVIRIRGIVSDSIIILQESATNISATLDAKTQQQEHLSHTQENLENAAQEIANSEEIIHSIYKFSEQIQLLAKNLSMEAKKASNDIHSETFDAQTCSEITLQTTQLQQELSSSSALMHRVVDEVRIASSQYMSNTTNREISETVNQNTADIVRALQFEDIVCQMSERVASHIGDIRILVDQLSHLYENELSTTFEEDLKSARKKMETIQDKLSKESAKVIVSQKNMDEGDIELF